MSFQDELLLLPLEWMGRRRRWDSFPAIDSSKCAIHRSSYRSSPWTFLLEMNPFLIPFRLSAQEFPPSFANMKWMKYYLNQRTEAVAVVYWITRSRKSILIRRTREMPCSQSFGRLGTSFVPLSIILRWWWPHKSSSWPVPVVFLPQPSSRGGYAISQSVLY